MKDKFLECQRGPGILVLQQQESVNSLGHLNLSVC